MKVGIAVDIIERCPELEWRVLKVALAAYARRVMYLKGMIPGTPRVDLDGNACGEVSARDAEYAVEFLASREARRAAAVAVKSAERVAKQMAVTAVPPPPPAAKTLKAGSAPIAVGSATTQGAFAKVRRLPYLRL